MLSEQPHCWTFTAPSKALGGICVNVNKMVVWPRPAAAPTRPQYLDTASGQPTHLFDFVRGRGRIKAVALAMATEAVQGDCWAAIKALSLQESLTHTLSHSPSPVPGASPREGVLPSTTLGSSVTH